MSNPYATPKAQSAISPSRKSLWRILKHACIFVILFLAVNFDRFFGSAESLQDIPKVSITASVITLLLFYGVGYMIFSRVRASR
jgi:predicted Na+-dependent transporter